MQTCDVMCIRFVPGKQGPKSWGPFKNLLSTMWKLRLRKVNDSLFIDEKMTCCD